MSSYSIAENGYNFFCHKEIDNGYFIKIDVCQKEKDDWSCWSIVVSPIWECDWDDYADDYWDENLTISEINQYIDDLNFNRIIDNCRCTEFKYIFDLYSVGHKEVRVNSVNCDSYRLKNNILVHKMTATLPCGITKHFKTIGKYDCIDECCDWVEIRCLEKIWNWIESQ